MKITKISKTQTVSRKQRLLEAFQAGEQLTAAQISSRFGLANPTATVSDLRYEGFAIYADPATLSDGTETTRYRLGTPSRELIAAGYRALSLGL